jgi:hypothetical protein
MVETSWTKMPALTREALLVRTKFEAPQFEKTAEDSDPAGGSIFFGEKYISARFCVKPFSSLVY